MLLLGGKAPLGHEGLRSESFHLAIAEGCGVMAACTLQEAAHWLPKLRTPWVGPLLPWGLLTSLLLLLCGIVW